MKEKKGIIKRLAFFGTVLALAALMCTAAGAYEATDKAAIGETGYATFKEALDAAQANVSHGTVITLLDNDTLNVGNYPAKHHIYTRITVDGQGKYGISVSGSGSVNIQVEVRFRNVVIEDSADHVEGFFRVAGGGHLILENSTVTAKGGWGGMIYSNADQTNPSVTLINTKILNSGSAWADSGHNGAAVSLLGGGTFKMDAASEITGSTRGQVAVAAVCKTGTIEINGKITGNTAIANGVYAGSGVTVTLGENADISGNGSNKVAVYTEDGATVTDNSGKYGKYGNKYYEPSVVAVSEGGAGYTSVIAALQSGGNKYLLKDAEFDATGSHLMQYITVSMDGQGHTVTVKKGTTVNNNITFKNITLDLKELSGHAFYLYDRSLTLDSGAKVVGAGSGTTASGTYFAGGNNGTIYMKEGSEIRDIVNSSDTGGAIRLEGNAVFNMTGGTITGCRANAGGAVRVKGSGKMIMSGGEITNNNSNWPQGGGIYLEGGSLTVSGDAKIYDNKNGSTLNNIYGKAANIIVSGEFSGKIGIRADNIGIGDQIATAADGASLASTDSVTHDNAANRFAYIKDGKLLITAKLTLDAETDTGVYDDGTLGVARVITTVKDVKNPGSVEYIGTLFYKTEANKETIENNAVKLTGTDLSKLEAGNGYMADVYGITGDTATVWAVNYYKFYGIEGVVFSDPITISYDKTAAKQVEYTVNEE